ncbi:MAG: PQQ-like beta-propeller repeat protein [Roseibacillus sp.]|nr:PQQ-like beta-propeller repeat protein [Roseibacillus sp.]
MNRLFSFLFLTVVGAGVGWADDWPQWLGEKRDGAWREEGVLRRLPEGGPKVLWRAPVAHGYSGPAVAKGRVYVMDLVIEQGKVLNDAGAQVKLGGTERVVCYDASSGKLLWTHGERRDYEVSYPGGPRATPTVDGGQVFALGTMGHLTCLTTGGVLQWKRDFGRDYGARVPMWGHSGSPLVYRDMVICMVGGEGSLVVAFDRRTGKERWRALSAAHCGYCPLQIVDHAGTKQLIAWHPGGVTGHNPDTGELYWNVPIKPTNGSAIAMPRKLGNKLFVSGYNRIGGMIQLDDEKPGARIAWRSGPKEGVYPVNSTPYLLDGTIYGVDVDRSALMAVAMDSGKRLWETRAPCLSAELAARQRAPRYGTAFLVYHPGNRQFWILGEMGDLIIAELSPRGYREVSRAHILTPTNTSGSRKVLWSHPAFAMRSAFVRNDKEMIRIDLAEQENRDLRVGDPEP